MRIFRITLSALLAAAMLVAARPVAASAPHAGVSEAQAMALARQFEAAWSALDPAKLEALFDTSWPTPLYQAEESRTLFDNWDSIRAYWKFCREYIERAELTIAETPRAVPLGQGLTLLVFQFHLDSELKLYAPMGFKPLGIDVRVNAIARDTPSGPRLIAYFEGSPGPIALMRQLLEKQVRPDYRR